MGPLEEETEGWTQSVAGHLPLMGEALGFSKKEEDMGEGRRETEAG